MNKSKVVVIPEEEKIKPRLSRRSPFSFGRSIFMTHTISRKKLNDWVVSVADESGQDLLWFGLGPVYVINVVGDVEIAKKAIVRLLPEHDQIYIETIQQRYNKTPEKEEIPGTFLC